MPVEYSYTEEGGLIIIGTGVVTGSEIVEANKWIYETREQIKALAFQLCDFSKVNAIKVTVDEIHTLAEQDRYAAKINPNILIAIVGEDNLTYGLARMWEAYVDEVPFAKGVFRTLEEARSWIETTRNNSDRKS